MTWDAAADALAAATMRAASTCECSRLPIIEPNCPTPGPAEGGEQCVEPDGHGTVGLDADCDGDDGGPL